MYILQWAALWVAHTFPMQSFILTVWENFSVESQQQLRHHITAHSAKVINQLTE